MRLIDVDALIADLEYDVELDTRALDCLDNESRRDIIQFDKDCKQNAIDLLRKAPTVQPEPDCALPEIIRCKNCKYLVVEEDGTYCDYNIVGVRGLEDGSGFCSDAKRKMDNE